MDKKSKIISESELAAINEDIKLKMGISISEMKEISYRKGCHQTVARIYGAIQEFKTRDEIVDFIGLLEDILGSFRHDEEPHPNMLDEAISRAKSF